MIRLFQTVFDNQMQVVPLIENAALHLGMMLGEESNLPVLFRDQLLVHRGYFDKRTLVRQVEIRGEELDRLTVVIKTDRERGRLVLPGQAIEVQQLGELSFAVVGELDGVGSQGVKQPVD